jgi:hypothetical protein
MSTLENSGVGNDGPGIIHSCGIREPRKPPSCSLRNRTQPGCRVEKLSLPWQHLAFKPDDFQILVIVVHRCIFKS